MGKRTNIDFSNHTITITKAPGLLIHNFGVPGSSLNRIRYINTTGIMAVTGDFGNWIFCREFHPSEEGGVSDQYWCEKLKIASTQKYEDYDPDLTEAEIKRHLAEEDLSDKERVYLAECLQYTEDEHTYIDFAYHHAVGGYEDGEYIPFKKRINSWLLYIFDGFDEICARLKTEKDRATIHQG